MTAKTIRFFPRQGWTLDDIVYKSSFNLTDLAKKIKLDLKLEIFLSLNILPIFSVLPTIYGQCFQNVTQFSEITSKYQHLSFSGEKQKNPQDKDFSLERLGTF